MRRKRCWRGTANGGRRKATWGSSWTCSIRPCPPRAGPRRTIGAPLKPGAKPEARTEAGVRPHNEVLFLLNLLGYEILHLGRVLMEQATRRGWSLRRFRERVLRVASPLRQRRRSDFRHQFKGRGQGVVAETAGVLGAGIVRRRRRNRARGRDRWGFLAGKSTCRRVTVPLVGKRFMTGSIVLFSSRFSRIDRASRETGLRPHENAGLEALINMFSLG